MTDPAQTPTEHTELPVAPLPADPPEDRPPDLDPEVILPPGVPGDYPEDPPPPLADDE